MWQSIKNRLLLILLIGCAISSIASSEVSAAVRIQAYVCGSFTAPTISSPEFSETSQNSTITLSGSGEPNMTVSIIENGGVVGMTTVTANGTYALDVPLALGNNTISVRETDGCGTSKESPPLLIVYQVPSTPSGQNQTPTNTPSQQSTEFPLLFSPLSSISASHPLEQLTPPASNTTGYPRPIITQPIENSIFTTSRIWVIGKAPIGSIVTIYVNNHSTARVNVSLLGSFGALTELTLGHNAIKVVAEQNSMTSTSDTVDVRLVRTAAVRPSNTVTTTVAKIAVIATAIAIPSAAFGIWFIRKINYMSRKK